MGHVTICPTLIILSNSSLSGSLRMRIQSQNRVRGHILYESVKIPSSREYQLRTLLRRRSVAKTHSTNLVQVIGAEVRDRESL